MQRLKGLSVVGASTGTCRMVSVRAITTLCLLAASSLVLVALVTGGDRILCVSPAMVNRPIHEAPCPRQFG